MQLPPPADLAPGTIVAERYRIVRRLGQGGMGVVFVAQHLTLEREVALKVLARDLARHETLVARFEREARAASKIGHHNIVNVLDFGRTDEGAPFIVMELLAGLDLGRTLRRDGAFSLARAAHVTRQLCAAMGAAHEKGVVHRDLKPENVFLCDGDVVKVLDFGLARFADAQPLTQAGMVFGTPEYMAPEQARGERADHRADIYAVGCILYEMLTGSVPYVGADAATVLAGHLGEPLEPASRRAPHLGIPRALEGVIECALHKEPAQRFPSMGALAAAIERAARAEASRAAAAPSTREAPIPPVPRSRAGLAILAAVVVAGAAVLAVSSLSGRAIVPAPAPPTPAPAASVSVPAPAPAPAPAPDEPRQPREVTIDSDPPNADVFRGAERLGATPLRWLPDDNTAEAELTVSKRGFTPHHLRVATTGSRAYSVTLRAIDRHTAHTPPPPPPASPTATSSKRSGPRELKDVFAE